MEVRSVCVFCGSRPGNRPEYLEAGTRLGTELARRGLTLVYGGASVGIMGAVADAVLAAGGRVVGVIPEFMKPKEIAHKGLTEQHSVGSMHERKALMAERADAFVALPGGFGTLDELFEIVTWAQLGLHRKPMGLLDTRGFFQPLVALARHLAAEGFVPEPQAVPFAVSESPSELVDRLMAGPTLPPVEKWLRRGSQT
ncbi:TIGR00730 family Rossman fold protein [Pyxidicoccus fallax]|uniref:Cytokinin riboside 5'-monophosphate phosphoribohydrolase n=1 Tax=Pyxidicoccus fallax TaxID=394095 RepID=A0A848LSP8_9BACT|nr:TIGR00730 family Rossman fold protein [Pyxidicoccus fallax]NMO20711.1 TIGR00730 family Rossman fold protein [Pyxidicoccus fallax]NPC81594.1 TIGR00730 family Rossman fold protein [Pyxidicoccus fallax]